MYIVYVIWSEKLQKRYVGHTQNLELRIREHNSGKTPFTRTGIPWRLIYKEEYQTRTEAIRREKFLKTGQGRKYLDEKLSYRGFSAEG